MKTVVISGASRGIGAAAARLFAQNGYAVAVNYRADREGAEVVVRDIAAHGGEAFAVCADMADATAVNAMAETVLKRCGSVDVIIHNAGVAKQALLTDTTPEEWRRMMGVHLDGAYHLAHAFVPNMVNRKSGSFLTVSSMWGEVGASCEVAYSAAKAGLIGFTKALAKELGPSGIRVNCVTPGVIDTAMCASFDEETRTALTEETPLMRLGTPQDVAEALLFLASDRASFITGQVLGVNGGFVI